MNIELLVNILVLTSDIILLGCLMVLLVSLLQRVLPGWLRFKTAPASEQKPVVYPKVAIIVPFYNEPYDSMFDTLTAIEQLDYPGELEFYLVDDGSTNDSPSKVQQWLTTPRKWHYHFNSLAENTGMKGKVMDTVIPLIDELTEVIGVIDSDTCLEPDALIRTVQALYSSPHHAAACGFIVPTNPQDSLLHFLQYYEHIGMLASVKYAQNQFGLVNVMAGAFALHKVSAIKALGGWGSWLVEDISWTWKAIASGYTMAYAHDAVAHTVCPSTHRALFNQRRRWARGRIEAFKSAWSVSKLKTLAMVPWLILYFQSALLPGLILVPLALLLDFGPLSFTLIGLNLGLFAALNLAAFLNFRKPLGLPLKDLPKSLTLGFIVDLFFMPANLVGMSDEIRKKHKDWITRKVV